MQNFNQITLNYALVTNYMAYYMAGTDLRIVQDHFSGIEKI